MNQAAKKRATPDQAVENAGLINSIHHSFAVIEFTPDGNILDANDNFLKTMGYGLDEIRGQNHRMFVDPLYASSLEYRRFWDELAAGKEQSREFKRVNRQGQPVWIKASYMPVQDEEGKIIKVVKLAQNYTEEHRHMTDIEGQVTAIGKSQAVIEFNMDGTIITANENFLKTVGYSLEEVRGKHHSMFADEATKNSFEYRQFWEKLNRGEFDSAQYKRFAKGGKEIWIQASYNPIFDFNGKPFKVVKFATDITAEKMRNADYEGQLAAIGKAQAVIEFNLDGTIITANDNFLKTLGYSLNEIKGQHHSMFADEEFKRSNEYRMFWEKLRRGEYDSGQYRRLGKGGKEVWIQASYNPIMDLNGKPFKVVKYATDVTEQVNRMNIVGELSNAANELSAASESLSASAVQMTSSSATTTEQANIAARSASELSAGVRVVATNTEEMRASIREIAQNANHASTMSKATQTEAQATNNTIKKLGDSSAEIGHVIKVISSIAQQTNLLALNATIEAARAGEAGRGFAVVANEVKELARQTATATEDITAKIGAIQHDSSEAVKAIVSITGSIEKLNAIAGSIATSVEEQSAASQEVARVVQDSSVGVDRIADNIKAVSSAASNTSEGSVTVQTSAKSLQELAARLQVMVKRVQGTK